MFVACPALGNRKCCCFKRTSLLSKECLALIKHRCCIQSCTDGNCNSHGNNHIKNKILKCHLDDHCHPVTAINQRDQLFVISFIIEKKYSTKEFIKGAVLAVFLLYSWSNWSVNKCIQFSWSLSFEHLWNCSHCKKCNLQINENYEFNFKLEI